MAKAEIMARFKRLGGGDAAKGAKRDMQDDRKVARSLSKRNGFGGKR